MTYAQKYVELVKTALKARGERDSDNNAAKNLGVTRTAIYNWKVGRNGIGIVDGYRIAKFLNLDPLDVVSDLHKDEFKEPEIREFFGLVADLKKEVNDAA